MTLVDIYMGALPDGSPIMAKAPAQPTAEPDRRPIAERMADDMIAAYEARGTADVQDLARAGWTDADVAGHGRQASAILRRRLGRRRIVAEA